MSRERHLDLELGSTSKIKWEKINLNKETNPEKKRCNIHSVQKLLLRLIK